MGSKSDFLLIAKRLSMTLLFIEIHFTYSRWLSPLFWLFVYYEGNLESSH